MRLRHLGGFFLLGAMVACTPPYAVPPNPPQPRPTPTASPTPAPGTVALTPATLAFTATGATNALPVTASQTNYTGSFTSSTTNCTGIATIATTSGTAFSVTPVAAGTCSFTITGGASQSATLSVTVTTTTVGGH